MVDKIYVWLTKNRADTFREGGMRKAINYLLNRFPGFKLFLKDVSIPLSNNDAERALRHGVMGRKNFYSSKTVNGAVVAATLYTVIETAKKAQLDPMDFIRYVIEQNNAGEKSLTPLAYARRIRTPVPAKQTMSPLATHRL